MLCLKIVQILFYIVVCGSILFGLFSYAGKHDDATSHSVNITAPKMTCEPDLSTSILKYETLVNKSGINQPFLLLDRSRVTLMSRLEQDTKGLFATFQSSLIDWSTKRDSKFHGLEIFIRIITDTNSIKECIDSLDHSQTAARMLYEARVNSTTRATEENWQTLLESNNYLRSAWFYDIAPRKLGPDPRKAFSESKVSQNQALQSMGALMADESKREHLSEALARLSGCCTRLLEVSVSQGHGLMDQQRWVERELREDMFYNVGDPFAWATWIGQLHSRRVRT